MAELEFILNQPISVDEKRYCEFKEVKGPNPVDSIKNTADEYVVAFLNSGGGCSIYWGIRNIDRIVVGVHLDYGQRDKTRRVVTEQLNKIKPAIAPTAYRIDFHQVYNSTGSVVDDLFVIEIFGPKVFSNDLYFTGSNETSVKTDGGKKKLTGPEIQDEILRRQKNYRNETNICNAWRKLNGRVVQLEPLIYPGRSSPQPCTQEWVEHTGFLVEEVTDSEVKLKKRSNGQFIYLPLFCLSPPWQADLLGRTRAKIEKGQLKFDLDKDYWIYKS